MVGRRRSSCGSWSSLSSRPQRLSYSRFLLLSTVLSSVCWTTIEAANGVSPVVAPPSANGNKTKDGLCTDGLILPAWHPIENLSTGDVVARGIIYFLALVYMFVGVSIIADRFMAAIEVITSKEKEVILKKPNGETQIINVRIWNETVSNLTLMALGSSAPEILLSIIEIYGRDYQAGDLGPGTIVGSAAFNMFVIIAICVWAVPCSENRKIKHLRVFFVTMTWSVFAYVWLYIIIAVISPGVVELWEGLTTFIFFPATVLTAYIADRRLLIYKYISKNYRMNKRGVIVGGEGEDMELGSHKGNHLPDGGMIEFKPGDGHDEVREFEEHRQQYIEILRELRRKHPDASMEELEMMARDEIMAKGPKSRAFYRVQATRKLMGGGNIMKRKNLARMDHKKDDEEGKGPEKDVTRIFFDPGHYTVMENVGQFPLTVSREANDLSHCVCVEFKTEDGTANAGSDYEEAEGTLVFRPGEVHKQIYVSVIDDDVFEEDEHFYVRLSNPRYLTPDGLMVTRPPTMNGGSPRLSSGQIATTGSARPPLELATPSVATVMILDDDHSGVYSFAESLYDVAESFGEVRILINRYSGARGKVILPYKTIDGTAKSGADYEASFGEIIFDNNETSKELVVRIIDNESYEKDALFYVELGDPILEEDLLKEFPQYYNSRRPSMMVQGVQQEAFPLVVKKSVDEMTEAEKIALLGKPRLGEQTKCQVHIKESKEFKSTVDKLFQKANISMMLGTSSWREQFIEAITVSAGDDDDDDGEDDGEGGAEGGEGEQKMPSCSDYVLHFFTIFWKVLFAFVPPTDYFDGWLCFVLSILIIGLLTAFIGDLAAHFGCTVGLADSVTAISLVALGTSVPDTFASKVAAINDKYADSSIGNVTGSNAVNVFLGIGIAWSIAAFVHMNRGSVFKVEPGNLAFSVTIFCVCAVVCAFILFFRRSPAVGGELGGPMRFKLPTTIFFASLWLLYVVLCSLEAYDVIEGF